MDNFVLIGVFVGLGLLFRRIPAFPEDTTQVLNTFALHVALPAVNLLKVPQLTFAVDMIIPTAVALAMLVCSAALVHAVGTRLH